MIRCLLQLLQFSRWHRWSSFWRQRTKRYYTTYTSAAISIKQNVPSTDHSMQWVINRDPLSNDPLKQRPMNDCALPTTRV